LIFIKNGCFFVLFGLSFLNLKVIWKLKLKIRFFRKMLKLIGNSFLALKVFYLCILLIKIKQLYFY
jgi:hypothetical protein